MTERHGGAPDGLIGRTIGHYIVRHKLAVGGTGSVYVAEHPWIGKRVALKVLHVELAMRPDIVGRFFNEARAVNDIQHPNIVDIIDFGVIEAMSATEPAVVYLLMEYLEGESLGRLVRRDAPLPPRRALTIALQIADALTASHAKGIVHRDLKPDNVMLVPRGREHDFVKILDFGIAKLTVNAIGSQRTQTGVVIGTPQYMSPEQCEGRSTVDHRTDIYALGVVLYEMLTGRVPFRGEGFAEVLVQALNTSPMPLSAIAPGIPPHVERAVLRALAKRPEERFQHITDLAAALQDPAWQEPGRQRDSFVGPLPGAPVAGAGGSSFVGPLPGAPAAGAGGGSFVGPLPGAPAVGAGGGSFIGPLPRDPAGREVSAVGPLPGAPVVGAGGSSFVGPLPGAPAAGAGGGSFVGPLPGALAAGAGGGSFAGPLPRDPSEIAAAAKPTLIADVEYAVPTTLNGTAAQSMALPARRGMRVHVALGLAAALAIAGASVGIVARRSADPPPAPAPAAAPVEAAPRIRLLIRSTPPGASVVVDGDPIGVTPFSGELDRRDAHVELELRLPGYQTATRTVALGDDVFQTISLERAPEPPVSPNPPSSQPAPSQPAPSQPAPRTEAVHP